MRHSLLLFLFCCLAPAAVRAEEVRLKNGDIVLGKVKSLDDAMLVLASESFGELKIARERIAVIIFSREAMAAELPPKGAAAPAKGEAPPATGIENDLVGQLRRLDPSYMKAIEQAFPLLNSSPEAKKYFTDRVEGLMSGKINVDDVRKDAKKVVAELEDLKAELGEETGAALDGYLGILKRFLDETDSDKTRLSPPKADAKKLELESPAQLQKKLEELEKKLKD